ncbi:MULTISPECIES: hypothetical protein [Kocuria]|uniref:hypothetical protein n=1 Tax=Kocuria TaxID=57493 RepID=UPI00080A893C|nr:MULTISPECIES: hypothetical protein [Kocuria]MCT1366674.1 hypothetical protein [Rothia sp. p3-SID1597]
MSTLLVVTEVTLGQTEIENINIVAPQEEGDDVRVVVPAALPKHLWLEFLDQLALLDFEEAVHVVSHAEKGPATLESDARAILEDSLAVLSDAGFTARGRVALGDPVAAMREEVETGAQQVLIITEPHPVEDTLNIHWSNQAERTLGVPVLHLYWGTGHVDD